MHGHDVQAFPRSGEPPQVRRKPKLGVNNVCGDVVELCRQAHPLMEVVRAPMRQQGGVERVSHQLGRGYLGGETCGLLRESRGAPRVTSVDPRPS